MKNRWKIIWTWNIYTLCFGAESLRNLMKSLLDFNCFVDCSEEIKSLVPPHMGLHSYQWSAGHSDGWTLPPLLAFSSTRWPLPLPFPYTSSYLCQAQCWFRLPQNLRFAHHCSSVLKSHLDHISTNETNLLRVNLVKLVKLHLFKL